MKAAAYSLYKPSPISWLDQMPEHWDAASLRWMSRRYSGGTPDKGNEAYWEDGEIPWINSGAVNDGYIVEPSALITHEAFANSSAKWILKNALVMALAGQGKTKGMVAQLGIKTTCNQSMAAIIPDRRFEPRYLYWWLTANYQNIRNLAGGEARDGLNLDMLGSIPCPVPPMEEQQTIARFLDAQTARIDTLVAKKRQLIAKLKEKRSALIARTVTRGLPPEAAKAAGLAPNPEMKDSGVEWLGEIPAHWESTQLKRTWAICEYGLSESLSGEGDIRVLTMGNIQDRRVMLPSAGCLECVPENMLLSDGDLLFNRTNSLAHVGKVGLYRSDGKGPVSFASYLVRIRTNSRTTPKFMSYLLNIPQLLSFARGLALPSINQANLNPTRYGQIHVALPPIQEQHMIVEYVDCETSEFDQLTAKVETAIARLTEYRQALITSAVTGKIDVRPSPQPSPARGEGVRMEAR